MTGGSLALTLFDTRIIAEMPGARQKQEVVAIKHHWPGSRLSACLVEEPQTGEKAEFRSYRNGLAVVILGKAITAGGVTTGA